MLHSRDEGIVWSQLRELDAKTQFAKFDTDGNGSIDADELLAAMHACGHASSTAKDAQALMREHGDGEPPALDNAQFQQVLESIDSTDHVAWQQEQERAAAAAATNASGVATVSPPAETVGATADEAECAGCGGAPDDEPATEEKHSVEFVATLSGIELGAFDAAARAEFVAGAADALGVGPDDVAVKSARAGSVVVDVEVKVADPSAGAAIAGKVADPQMVLANPDKFGESSERSGTSSHESPERQPAPLLSLFESPRCPVSHRSRRRVPRVVGTGGPLRVLFYLFRGV